MSVTPRGMSIQEAYREYRDGSFLVNRQYQRKLVWTLNEKRKLIDSVLNGYPIPLILLATRTLPDGSREFEILDGMQRLHAIFSFVENFYSVDGKFFDVSQLSRAKQLAEEGKIKAELDKAKLLEPEKCADFLDYTLAVTEYPANDPSAVNEVFGRINAYGRQLSSQEQRQAGVISPFANAIRELAAEIRGDVSKTSLNLADMPEISIDISGTEEGYGISAEETFWCKQGILRKNQLREGEDEQFLADLAISILEGKPFGFSGTNLNTYYEPDSDSFASINAAILSYGVEALKNDILTTISILRDVIEAADKGTNAFRRIVHPEAGGNPVKTAFYAVFMAFFKLCIQDEKSPIPGANIMGSLAGIQTLLHVAAGQIRSEPRQTNINTVIGNIQSHFEHKVPPVARHGPGVIIRFENSIRRSKIETSAFECKQGLLNLSGGRSPNTDLLDKIVQTICGIANLGPDSTGALFLGVADSKADKDRIAMLDSVEGVGIGDRYIVGVERELPHMSTDLDGYVAKIVNHIMKSGLSEPLKTAILGQIDCLNYRGLSVICIWITAQSVVSHVNDVVYVRRGSHTHQVAGLSETQAVMAIFSGKKAAT